MGLETERGVLDPLHHVTGHGRGGEYRLRKRPGVHVACSGAAAALAGVEPDYHRCRLRHRKIPRVAADLPVGAGDLASVEVDDEVFPAEAVLGARCRGLVLGESGPIRVTRWRQVAASVPAAEV
nr:hypothetical protein OH837_40755 [Streptomyces canus]